MFPPQFDYYRASSVEEAIELLEAHGGSDGNAAVLAGGQSLLTEMKKGRRSSRSNSRSSGGSDSSSDSNPSPDVLVDVGGIDSLREIAVADGEEDATTIGALTTYADVVESRPLRELAPAFAEATENVGDVQIRNRGTVGGNLAQADPEGDLPAAALVSDATIAIRGPDGERTVAADEFFRGPYETVVEDGELVTEIRIPYADGTAGAYAKKTHPASGYAMVGVAAVLEFESGDGTNSNANAIADARIAANGVAERTMRLPAVEDALVGESMADVDADTLEAAAERAGDDVDRDSSALLSDAHASGEFRVHLLPSYVERALETALERAAGDASAGTDPVATDGGERR